MELQTDEFYLSGAVEYGSLRHAYKRFRSPYLRITSTQRPPSGISLLFMHCVGTHKETWVPTIQQLYEIQQNANNTVNIIEAWSMDSPDHGYAATLNDAALLKTPEGVTAYVAADGFRQLLSSGLVGGDRIVTIGHSAGASVVILATHWYPLERLPFSSMILVEPPMMTRPLLERMLNRSGEGLNPIQMMTASARTRRDIWGSREEAYEWFVKRMPWKTWDPRVLKLFVNNSLRDLPTGIYPDRWHGVTLSCTRMQEAAGYQRYEDAIDSLKRLSELFPVLPVHCIFGSRDEVVSEETRAGIMDAGDGRKATSMHTVEGAGHLIPQEDPRGMAHAIWMLLERATTKRESSRL